MEEAIIKFRPWHHFHSEAIVRLLYDDKAQQILHLKGCIIYGNFCGCPLVFAKKCANKNEPIIKIKIIPVSSRDLMILAFIPPRLNRLMKRIMTMLPKAPIAPASVGVIIPPYIPPMTMKNRVKTGQVLLRA